MIVDYRNLQKTTLRVLEPAALGDKLSKFCDISLSSLVLLNLLAVTLESVPELEKKFSSAFYFFEVFSVSIFTTEYIARIWSAPARRPVFSSNHVFKSRWQYMKSFYGIIDLISIIPFYLQTFFPGLDLRVLRTLRLYYYLKTDLLI